MFLVAGFRSSARFFFTFVNILHTFFGLESSREKLFFLSCIVHKSNPLAAPVWVKMMVKILGWYGSCYRHGGVPMRCGIAKSVVCVMLDCEYTNGRRAGWDQFVRIAIGDRVIEHACVISFLAACVSSILIHTSQFWSR